MTETETKRIFVSAMVSAALAVSAVAPATAQINLNPLSGATPTLNQTINLPGSCPLRVVVPMDRSNPAATVTASVSVELRWRAICAPVRLGNHASTMLAPR